MDLRMEKKIQIGDSLLKQANSKEFMIKRGNKIAIYILMCND
jgi:hypothetical protein